MICHVKPPISILDLTTSSDNRIFQPFNPSTSTLFKDTLGFTSLLVRQLIDPVTFSIPFHLATRHYHEFFPLLYHRHLLTFDKVPSRSSKRSRVLRGWMELARGSRDPEIAIACPRRPRKEERKREREKERKRERERGRGGLVGSRRCRCTWSVRRRGAHWENVTAPPARYEETRRRASRRFIPIGCPEQRRRTRGATRARRKRPRQSPRSPRRRAAPTKCVCRTSERTMRDLTSLSNPSRKSFRSYLTIELQKETTERPILFRLQPPATALIYDFSYLRIQLLMDFLFFLLFQKSNALNFLKNDILIFRLIIQLNVVQLGTCLLLIVYLL